MGVEGWLVLATLWVISVVLAYDLGLGHGERNLMEREAEGLTRRKNWESLTRRTAR